MSQHDMIIDNASGSTVRSDLNNALQALASTSKSTAAPSTVYAGQHWVDDNTPSASKWTEFQNDGTDNIPLYQIDTTNNVAVFPVGGGSAQSIASATTTDLGSVGESTIVVTGTTTITGFGTSARLGDFKFVKFSGALTLTHNATSLILPSAANITTAANDTLIAECIDKTNGYWRVHSYCRADGTPVGGSSYYVGSTTRDVSTASGTQAITGVGFKPKAIIAFAAINATKSESHGIKADGSADGSIYALDNLGGGYLDQYGVSTNLIIILTGSTPDQYAGVISSFDTDGFTISWTKTGSPTGTLTIKYICIR